MNEIIKNLIIDLSKFWYLWILIAVLAIAKLFQPKIRGLLGEKTISVMLSTLSKDKYTLLNNILLKTERGTTQIDHIIVSVYGIFVIETKNYKGWIFGCEKDEYWIQNLYGKKSKFKNPIRQNYGHVKALEALLVMYKEVPIFPIVAFSGECTLKVKLNSSEVVYFSRLLKNIKQYNNEVISFKKAQEIQTLISVNNIDTKDTRKDHVGAIRRKISDNNLKITSNICPKCGGVLVERTGTYGKFIGCTNYPKCRFTLN